MATAQREVLSHQRLRRTTCLTNWLARRPMQCGRLARVERVQIRGRTSRVRTAAAESDDEDEENVTTPNLHQWAPLDVAPAPNAHKRHRLEETPPDRRLVTKLRRINGHWYVALPNPF